MADYDNAARKTAIYADADAVMYPALGLVSEAGEVAGVLKKAIRDNGGELSWPVRLALLKECGDVLWYLSALARDLGSSLEDVARMNIAKLQGRSERGTLQGSGDDR